MKIIDEGSVYTIQNDRGEYWLGPHLARSEQWQAPRELGASVPCWMTSSRDAARAQFALLVADPEPSVLERFADELVRKAREWHGQETDPKVCNEAVAFALQAAAACLLRAMKSPGV